VSSRVEKINQWLLLVSHAAIVGGLVLVAVQINQEMNVAEVQMFNEATSSRIAQEMTMMGENPASTIAKSLTAPDSLTLAELRVLDAYFIAGVNEIRRTQVLEREGLDLGTASFEDMLTFRFGNEFGKSWWAQFISEGEEMNEVNLEMDALIRDLDPSWTMDFFDSLRTRLASEPQIHDAESGSKSTN
jgi:hypothetical protein